MAYRGFVRLLLTAAIVISVAGCFARQPKHVLKKDAPAGVRHIIVMPVQSSAKDDVAAGVVRRIIVNELYFKGYSKIPLDVVDSKLRVLYPEKSSPGEGTIPPTAVGAAVGGDAVLYCTILNWDKSFFGLYGSQKVELVFEMRGAAAGETIWSAQESGCDRFFDITPERVVNKCHQCFETIVNGIVGKALSTLPDGPNALAAAPQEKKWWRFW
ncbi:MAG: hypothetical protein JW884_05730 [Deltaproteobacteria bacterium]|nr:hypothetical protein [Deltaproteobacteria bacterium]